MITNYQALSTVWWSFVSTHKVLLLWASNFQLEGVPSFVCLLSSLFSSLLNILSTGHDSRHFLLRDL